MPPTADQVEVTLFGPGYGECALVHLGNGHWIIVDSCLDNSIFQPAALSYLEDRGIDPAQAVKLVVATHWHDDHIGGMHTVVSRCTEAKFCCSLALGRAEFLGMVRAYEKRNMIAAGPGVREIAEVFEGLRERNQSVTYAAPNRPIYLLESDNSGHGQPCRVWTLSPSDKQIEKFFTELTLLMPRVKETKYRCTPQMPNHLSVVTWIEIGEMAILLGGDLEETGDVGTGWSVIVASAERPPGRASIFKIPHHGSANAHNDDVWTEMLVTHPFAILAPWNRGSKLPSRDDVDRINKLTTEAYASAKLRIPRAKRRSAPVEKTLREAGIKLRRAEPTTGAVRLRNGGNADPTIWQVQLFKNACRLSEVYSAA